MYSLILQILTCFPKETRTTRSCCVRPPGCLPSSLRHLLNWRADLSHTGQRGQQSERQDAPAAFAICIAVCSREGLFLFQLRDVLISSSFISYQETEAKRFHHFRFYFFLSSALAYIFRHLLPLSEQCHSLGRSCCLSSCYSDQYSCLCSTAAYLLNFACLKIIGDAAGRPAGSQKSHRSCEVCQETGNPSCTGGVSLLQGCDQRKV